jgi:hypothetical protein
MINRLENYVVAKWSAVSGMSGDVVSRSLCKDSLFIHKLLDSSRESFLNKSDRHFLHSFDCLKKIEIG